MIASSLFIMIAVYVLAPFAIEFFAGKELNDAVHLLRILSFYIFFGGLSLYLGTPLLVAFGFPKPFNVSVVASTFVLLAIYCLLYWLKIFTVVNFALVLGITELFIVLFRLFYCLKNKILSI